MGTCLHALVEERSSKVWTPLAVIEFGKQYELQRFLSEHAHRGWPENGGLFWFRRDAERLDVDHPHWMTSVEFSLSMRVYEDLLKRQKNPQNEADADLDVRCSPEARALVKFMDEILEHGQVSLRVLFWWT
jgi:hypothetical protein